MNEQKNLLLAIVLSIVVLFGFDHFFGTKPQPAPQGQPAREAPKAGEPQTPQGSAPSVPAPAQLQAALPADPLEKRAKAVEGPRVKISTPSLHGSIALEGARIDDVTLARYREHPDLASPEIVLFSPPGAPQPYYAEAGWVSGDSSKIKLPDGDTVWTASGDQLSPAQPLTLSWENGEGLTFTRTVALDNDYMFTITDKVANKGQASVSLSPYALVARTGKPKVEGMYILHEGPLGVVDGKLKEMTYEDLDKATNGVSTEKSKGGWVGVTDKYWLAAVSPGPDLDINTRFLHRRSGEADKYQVDYLGNAKRLEPGQEVVNVTYVFAGAKQVKLLDGYAEKLGIPRFDLAIDFGWFYFLTKPFFYILQFFNGWFGQFGLAILALTVLVKAALFPLANKSYVAMSKMKALQPQLKKLQESYADDRNRLNQEMMALYKREKVNPMAGCLPIFIQIPVFFALYKVLFVTIEMRHAPFYGWIHDLSAPDPTTLFNLFGLIPWSPPSFLMIGVWPLIMGATMYLQQKLNPQPTDPVQAKMFMILPFVFTYLLASFPAGLVIYWSWSNMLSILQQWVIMRRMGVKA
jgi:YidC/Oxa1 family membrane protein insertase